MTERMVVVGGDAAGMSAASQAKRLAGDKLEVLAFERGAHSSYSACGIPYWVAGDVGDGEQLVARTPEAHRANGIDLRMLTDVEAIDLQAGTVAVPTWPPADTHGEGFDHLVLATGAVRCGCCSRRRRHRCLRRPDLDDGRAPGHRAAPARRAVVIGGGYIGVEMAEGLARRHVAVTVVDQAPQPMSTLDPHMGELVHEAMEKLGIDVHTDTAVTGFDTDGDGRVRSVQTTDGPCPPTRSCSASGSGPTRHSPARPVCPWATTAASAPTCRCGCSATNSCGRRGLRGGPQPGLRPVPARPWGPTPTSTAG